MTKDAQAALKPFYSETSNTIKSSTSSNSDVIELQKALQKAGQKWLPVTGELDENTRKAIKQFKDSKGLKDNIGAGAMTKEAQTVLKQYYM
jgi:peptidoglycan hydrolase-like protein with peptidoglycan-binding domain